MTRKDIYSLLFIIVVVIAIYYPAICTTYLYTDDATQLWYNNNNINFITSVPQGRYLSYKIFQWLFTYIKSTDALKYARLFSLAGWIFCLPVWYFIINKTIQKNELPKILVYLSMVYIVTMPPFTIYVGWAACLELFIACTSGLIAGYVLCAGLFKFGKIIHLPLALISIILLFGLISLFTYQNGFGCFFIPFFIDFLRNKKFTKTIVIAFIASFLIYIIYYFLFRYSIIFYEVQTSSRTSLSTNPFKKLLFLFARPLASAFHFTYLFADKSVAGFITYLLIAGSWLTLFLKSHKEKPAAFKASYLFEILAFFIIIYLPSLIANENFSSNRTLFALNLAVFFVVAQPVFSFIKNRKTLNLISIFIAIFFISNAWYNFNKEFTQPLALEFKLIKTVIDKQYTPAITSIYIIRPDENTFQKKYGLVPSWDEFGSPSTAKNWVPEPLFKQLIFEKTGSRQLAENVKITSWANKNDFIKSGEVIIKETLLIDLQEMIDQH